MNPSIGVKLFVTIFATSFVLVVMLVALARFSLGRGLARYLHDLDSMNLESAALRLEQDFARDGKWVLPPLAGRHLAVVDPAGKVLAGEPAAASAGLRQPLHHQGKVVAYLAQIPQPGPDQQLFLAQQLRNLALIGLAGLVLSALTAVLLANSIRKSLHSLKNGTQQLAAGNYGTRIPVTGGDEFGQLATHFNQLAATLERGAESRKQWIADVSHELRTPLAVLRAEIEALQDGVRPADPKAFELLHTQVLSLSALTDDLFQLARSDLGQLSYKMQEVDLWKLLREATDKFQSRFQRSGIELSLVRESSRLTSTVWGDSERLSQLLNNFLENSLRYTHPPGRVEVRCQSVGSQWIVRIDDSPPGVAPELIERLFERFFRVEGSRSKQLGGAGLGLAICQNIAQAHNGHLRASASPLGGLRLELILPCYPR